MSQVQSFGAGGAVPGVPAIETLTGNTGGPVGGSGLPVNINVLGDTAQGVFVNGTPGTSTELITVQDSTAAATSGAALKGVASFNSADFTDVTGYVSLANRNTATVTTTDATVTTIITLPLGATPGLYTVRGSIGGFIPASNAGGSYDFVASIKTDGATATQIGVSYDVVLEDVIMEPSDIQINVSGNNALVQVQGLALTTIDWVAEITYTVVN